MRWIFSLLGFVLLIGCGESKKPTPSAPARNVETPAAPAAAKPAEKPVVPSIFSKQGDEYTYNPVGKRDPFRAYKGELIQDITLPTSPLERYELDQLALTAIVWGIANPRALIQAPDGQSYIVRKDMRMGKNRGRVAKITRRELFIEEEYRDPTGKLVVRESKIEIRPKEDDKEVQFKVQEQ